MGWFLSIGLCCNVIALLMAVYDMGYKQGIKSTKRKKRRGNNEKVI